MHIDSNDVTRYVLMMTNSETGILCILIQYRLIIKRCSLFNSKTFIPSDFSDIHLCIENKSCSLTTLKHSFGLIEMQNVNM